MREALSSPNVRVHEIWITAEAGNPKDDLFEVARAAGVKVFKADRNEIGRRADTDKHQGVAARLTLKVWSDLPSWSEIQPQAKGGLVLALDSVVDPHNVGALLRSAHFFGAGAVVLLKDRAASLTGVVAKASAGALFSIPIVYATNLAREMDHAEELGFWRIGLDAEAETCLESVEAGSRPVLLVVGGEESGLRRLTKEKCDQLVRLSRQAHRDSLNASVAGAIALYEIRRKT